MKALVLLGVLIVAACNPNPTPASPSTPDATDAAPFLTSAAAACLNLVSISCSDGKAPDCATALAKAAADGKFRIDVAGLTAAKTIVQAQAAGAACK